MSEGTEPPDADRQKLYFAIYRDVAGTLKEQLDAFERLRTRALAVFSAATAAVGFLAGLALRGDRQIGGLLKAGAAGYALLGVLTALVLLPGTFITRNNAHELIG